jgi:hypothetical protein
MVSASTSWNRYLQSYIAVYSPPFSQNVMLQHHLRLKARGPLRFCPPCPAAGFGQRLRCACALGIRCQRWPDDLRDLFTLDRYFHQ